MRVCAYRHCAVPIDHMRPQAKYCSAVHRAAEFHEHERSCTELQASPVEAYGTVSRRPSRDGKGTRVYLTPWEAASLSRLVKFGHFKPQTRDRLHNVERKLNLAAERAARKENG